MKKRMVKMIIALIVVFGGIFAFDLFRSMMIKHFIANYKNPPQTISAQPAKLQNWSPTISAVGTLTAINGVNITPQIAGQVTSINFTSGQIVKKDQILLEEDTRQNQQDLNSYQAALNLAKIEYWRQEKLYKDKFVTGDARDEALSNLKQAQANVDKTKVVIDQMTIKAPFDGKIGIRQVNLGEYVTPGSNNIIATLEQLNPLHVDFDLPEQYYGKVQVGQAVILTVDAYPNMQFTGKVIAIDSNISTDTRNLAVRAIVDNPDLKLYPGMFANIKVLLPQQNNVVTIPQTALAYNLYGSSVFVLTPAPTKDAPAAKSKKDKTAPQPLYVVHRQFVKEGETRGNEIQILSGLKAGDLVVTSGELKIDDGALVNINNAVDINQLNPSETS